MYQQQVMFYGGNKFIFKMIKTFDYIFYRISFFFRQISVVGDLNSITIISIVETWNLVSITKILFIILNREMDNINLHLTFFVVLFLIALNSIRYYKFKRYQDLDKLWKRKKKIRKIKRGVFILIYLLFSLIIYVII